MAAATVAATTAASVVAAVPVTKAAATTTLTTSIAAAVTDEESPPFFFHFHFELPTVWWWFIRVNYLPRQVEYYRLCTVECCTSCTSSYCLFLIQLFTKLNKATPTMTEAKRDCKGNGSVYTCCQCWINRVSFSTCLLSLISSCLYLLRLSEHHGNLLAFHTGAPCPSS